MKHLLLVLVALFVGVAHADTFVCKTGMIAISHDHATFVNWGSPGNNFIREVVSISYGQIIIGRKGPRHILNSFGGGQFGYLYDEYLDRVGLHSPWYDDYCTVQP